MVSFIPVGSWTPRSELPLTRDLDLKPENVLIAIDDVEALIEAELAVTAANPAPPTRLVGVPPSKGRGGNQTPRSESIHITGSQPLPSPSSSYNSTTAIDKWSFAMSKIDNGGSKSAPQSEKDRSGSTDAATKGLSNVSLDISPPPIGDKKSNPPTSSAGPSLLSQQAPSRNQSSDAQGDSPDPGAPSRASSNVDIVPDSPSASMLNNGLEEKITVKIADLGNGTAFLRHTPSPAI